MAAGNGKYQLYCCGSRGSRPVEGRRFNEFGGFTSCYVLKKNDYALIIDCGTGLYEANAMVLDCPVIDVVLTHLHYDHILGMLDWTAIPKNSKVTFYGGFKNWFGEASFEEFFRTPFWPVKPDFLLKEIPETGKPLVLQDDLSIEFYPANHPNNSQQLLIRSRDHYNEEHRIAVMFDNEDSGSMDKDLIAGCDYLLYDGMYTDSEYSRYKGYGHSTWQEGCRLASRVNCKRLIITHHDPNRVDEQLRRFEKIARDLYPSTDFARSGMKWEFPLDADTYVPEKEAGKVRSSFGKVRTLTNDRFTELFITGKDRMRYVSVGCYALLGLVSFFMTIVNIMTQQTYLMISTFIFAVLCGLDVLFDLVFKWDYHTVQNIFQVEICSLFLFFIISGYPEGFSALWALMLPVAGMFVFGKKRNSILCATMFVIFLYLFYTPIGRSSLNYQYTEQFMLRFPMAFLSFFLLSYFLETVRENTFNELESLRTRQAEIIADQTSELREQNFGMVRINSKLQLRNKILIKEVGKELTDDEIRDLLGDNDTEEA